ncbi:hypothetical protein LWC34_15470 [Kibdelosporangium philippinense]|uniref:Uncharacterized protein n=1 Tax=Kibdelosporangium philippinense TaxID=211113 RepID=A0ABS8ZAP6_9PSEU|nr:hypothetical protein [Kibdelosporangium philippinense]MCE7004224.1 hypothetical protein [Kibdelosporangium philippinense]
MRTRALAIITSLVTAGAVLMPGTASAEPWPSNCDWGISGLRTTSAKCKAGGGYYRAVAKCTSSSYAYGSWEPAGTYPGFSQATCGNSPIAANIGLCRVQPSGKNPCP